MAISYVDTREVASIVNDIKKSCSELDDEFDRLFRRLNSVPNDTKEWVGQSASYYFNKVYLDKVKYAQFVNLIRNIANNIDSDMMELEQTNSRNVGIE